MTLQFKLKVTLLASLVSLGLAACGGGGGGSNETAVNEPPTTPPVSMPPATASAVSFGDTIADLVAPDGSVTLPDGRTYDADSAPIEMSDYTWEVDNTDADESVLDDAFSE